MGKQWILRLFLSLMMVFLITSPAAAQKKIKRDKQPHPYGAFVKPKIRTDGRAMLLMFGGMDKAEEVKYLLTYNAGPVPQGIESYHTPTDGNIMKELVFGTCSGKDCVYHGNINEMELEITLELKDGRVIIQRYEVNVPELES